MPGEQMGPPAPAQPKIRLDPTLTAGALIQIGVLVVGFITYLLAGSSEVKSTAAQVLRLEQAVAGQASATREAIREQVARLEQTMADLRKDAGLVPQLGEQLRSLERDARRHDEGLADARSVIEARRTSVDNRLDAMRQQLIELRSDVTAMQRGYAAPAPPRWGRGEGQPPP